jgi:hypothetical protein
MNILSSVVSQIQSIFDQFISKKLLLKIQFKIVLYDLFFHENEYLKHLNANLVFISADILNFALFTNLSNLRKIEK